MKNARKNFKKTLFMFLKTSILQQILFENSIKDYFLTSSNKVAFNWPYSGIEISWIVVNFLFLSNLESFLCKHSLTHDTCKNLRAISYSREGFLVIIVCILIQNKVIRMHPEGLFKQYQHLTNICSTKVERILGKCWINRVLKWF